MFSKRIWFILLLCGGLCLLSCRDQNSSSQETKTLVSPPLSSQTQEFKRTIVFFGDSLTAGYGVDSSQAYPAVIEGIIREKNWNFRVVNAGISGETSSAALRRLQWIFQKPFDLLVIEIGANDGLRGIPLKEVKANLREMIRLTRKNTPHAEIILTGMKLPPNLGKDYTKAFESIYIDLAREEKVGLIPFLLEGVGGEPTLNLPDGIHPTVEGHKIIAQTVWRIIKPTLQSWE